MNERGARGILASKVKLGGDASVALARLAGCVSRYGRDSAFRNLKLLKGAWLVCWSLLEGSTIRPDNGDNRRVYGRKVPRGKLFSPDGRRASSSEQLISTLDARTPKHRP